MLIATWNVNSIRSRLDQVKEWLSEVKPDLLCLQETKVPDEAFPEDAFKSLGYKAYFYGQKAYNGVAFLSQTPLEDVRTGFTGELSDDSEAKEFSDQKRVISALIEGIRVINLYVPNGSSLTSDKFIYKIKWLNCLKRYLDNQEKRDEPVCLLGDFNIALDPKDIHHKEILDTQIMASPIERENLKIVLGERLIDVFRVFEQQTNHWTWWDYRNRSWEQDKGWRIDHIYLSDYLLQNSKNCEIHKKVRDNIRPSDHAPVVVEINWPPSEEQADDWF